MTVTPFCQDVYSPPLSETNMSYVVPPEPPVDDQLTGKEVDSSAAGRDETLLAGVTSVEWLPKSELLFHLKSWLWFGWSLPSTWRLTPILDAGPKLPVDLFPGQ